MDFEGNGQIELAFEDLFEKLDEIGFELETDDGDGNDVRPITRKEWLTQVAAFFDTGMSKYKEWSEYSWEV